MSCCCFGHRRIYVQEIEIRVTAPENNIPPLATPPAVLMMPERLPSRQGWGDSPPLRGRSVSRIDSSLDEGPSREVARAERAGRPRSSSVRLVAVRFVDPSLGLQIQAHPEGDLETLLSQTEEGRSVSDFNIRDREIQIKLMISLAEELLTAHEQGDYHGDIRPSNILLGRDESEELICCLGMKDLEDDAIDTPQAISYLSPEVCKWMIEKEKNSETQAIPKEFLGPIDIWALGITFYKVYCGEDFYKGVKRTDRDSLLAHIEKLDSLAFQETLLNFKWLNQISMGLLIRGMLSPKAASRLTASEVWSLLRSHYEEIKNKRVPEISVNLSTTYDPWDRSMSRCISMPMEPAVIEDLSLRAPLPRPDTIKRMAASAQVKFRPPGNAVRIPTTISESSEE